MPIDFGKFVVSFHRPELQKKLRPNEKDNLLQNAELSAPALQPLKRSRPLVEFSRPSPYNRFLSHDAVNRAIAALPQTTSPAQLVAQVRAHLNAHTALKGAPRS